MKKFYSLVLMATALLIGTNAWAEIRTANDATSLKNAWEAAQDGDEIQLTGSFTISNTLWLGTATMADVENVRSITLNLNNQTLTSSAQKVFVLTHGALNVTGTGVIEHAPTAAIYDPTAEGGKGEYKSAFEVFRLYGSTYKDVDAKNLQPGQVFYTHLTIGANVKILAAVNGIVVDKFGSEKKSKPNEWPIADAWAAGNVTIPTANADKFALYTDVYSSGNGVAHGVCIDVNGTIEARKYAIKANGNLRTPAWSADNSGKKIDEQSYRSTQYSDRNSTRYVIAANDEKNYSPFIHVHDGAKLLTTETTRTDAVAAYGGGYARWLVEGNVEGSTAVYVKSGEIDIKNAIITSNFEGTPGVIEERSSGVNAGGSGVVVESSANYAGGQEVTIEGNTVITPTTGYALEEEITDVADTTKVTAVDIQGGTFKEGDAGTITVTDKTAGTSVSIDGGTFEYANETGGGIDLGGKNLVEFLTDQATTGDNTHTVIIATDNEGHQTVVISEGDKPAVANSVIGAAENASINWKNDVTKTETLTGSLKLAELQISQDYEQTLIVDDGAYLEVGRVVLAAKAKIIVKAGGKFVVSGEQGLAAYQESNIILETQEGKPAIFLFNPAVTSNTHPMATVQFISKSITDGSFYTKQRFGIPTFGAVTSMTTQYGGVDVQTAIAKFYYDENKWKDFGWINVAGKDENLDQMANSFDYYQMQHNTPNMGTVVTMTGELVGNVNPTLGVRGNFWNGYANSYMAPIDGTQLINMIPNTVQKAIYMYDITQDYASWEPYTLMDIADQGGILPMQPFLIRNSKEAADVVIDYTAAVYNPAMGIAPNAAPARNNMSDITRANIIVKGENSIDRVKLAEGDMFSAEFDNGYEAEKYMNDGINMYVSADEKMSVFATNDIEGTYVGFQALNGGNYTIEFAKVQGEELALVDHATGARVAIVEGATYEFTAEGIDDYRFEIVKPAKMPTAIDNTNAVKSVKGIYTITGQYMGEMNVWSTLPAGVYVVNGEKLVK